MANGTLFSNHSSKVPEGVLIATITSSGISAGCCGVFLLSYLAFSSMRSSPRNLLFYISLMDLSSALSYAYGAIRNSETTSPYNDATAECVAQSVVSTYSSLCSFLWTIALGVFLLVTICTVDPLFAEKLTRYFHIVCWGLPLGLVILALGYNSLGYTHSLTTAGWCWVNTDRHDAVKWMLITGIVWEIMTCLCLVILAILVKWEIKKKFKEPSITKLNGTLKSMKRIEKKMRFLPFLFIILRIWDILRFCLAATKSSHVWNPLLMALQGIGNSSHGTTNFVIFFLCSNKTRKKAVREICDSVRHLSRARCGQDSRRQDEERRLVSEDNAVYSYVNTR